MKKLICLHCGHLLEQGEIQEWIECTEINNLSLGMSGRKDELDSNNKDTVYGDQLIYVCAECEKQLVGYTYEDIIQIFKNIDANRLQEYKCSKCDADVYKSQNKKYFAQCYECDEYFYEIELNKIK